MELYIDSADLGEIEDGLKRGFASGITTNPALLSRAPKGDFEEHIKKIVELIRKYDCDGMPLSVEVFSRDPDEILAQARRFREAFDYEGLVIKVHIGWNELMTMRSLVKDGFSVNCTACMTVLQAAMAANVGVDYVSFFFNRIRDADSEILKKKLTDQRTNAKKAGEKNAKDFQAYLIAECGKMEAQLQDSEKMMELNRAVAKDFDPVSVISSFRQLLDKNGSKAKIIAGSMRSVVDVKDAMLAGAHIVTVPPMHFPGMINHYKTDEAVAEFLVMFKKWQEQ